VVGQACHNPSSAGGFSLSGHIESSTGSHLAPSEYYYSSTLDQKFCVFFPRFDGIKVVKFKFVEEELVVEDMRFQPSV
jgi:hypothetical protein